MQQQDNFMQEHTFFPFGKGALTANGIQHSTAVEATDGTTIVLVEEITCNPGGTGVIEEMGFSLTAAYQTDQSEVALTLQWDAKQTDATTWVNLVDATRGEASTSYIEYTASGQKSAVTNLLRVPIDVRLRFHGEDATCHADAKAKNSSWVKLKWRPSTQG